MIASMTLGTRRLFPTIDASKSVDLHSLFPHCNSLRHLQQLHAQILIHGIHLSNLLGSKLADSYFASGHSHYARQAFDQMPSKNPQSWNTMLSGYLNTNTFSEILPLYQLYRAENQNTNSYSLVFIIRACTKLSLKEGKSIHSEAIKFGLETNTYVSPSLINMYHELGSLEDAEKVFKQAPLLNPTICGLMMKGYSKASMDLEVVECFDKMKELRVQLNPCAAVCLARAFGNLAAAKQGRAIHALFIKSALMASNVYLQTSLLDMYMKSGFIECAHKLFGELPCKDIVSWSTMVARLAQCGRGYESLLTFQGMLEESIIPNAVTLSSVLLACSHLGSLLQGKSTHGYILRHGIELDIVAYTALLDMYAKCGSIDMAYKVFDQMQQRNIFTWTAMIGGFGMHGMVSRVLDLFHQMRLVNEMPNSVTFVSLLSALSHSGSVQKGIECFKSMNRDYGLSATNEHYSCMVDLFGRAGLIEEAETLIKNMPIEPSASVWGALLGACRIHKHGELAEQVANKLFALDHDMSDTHVLLSNIYGASETWEMVKKTREKMNERDLQKTLGFSSIEVDKKVYVFGVCDTSKSWDSRIAGLWNVLSIHMKEISFIDFQSRENDVDEVIEEIVYGCTQKFAITF
ncbi:pentatricopeptide repeat-containing protein At1g06140, mitochondrial [Dendrobium catenatum]|nr:pentatricopeptide repeat-containing protein At1g06140, mitochondrial [Dendrobium catenatum]XP_028554268.1 pentatricopeptide repeat-containing protein At1g06140, mitochondrial [Dendrobium catenatum]XP_028554269.1 pentatricopeptide repeat-containing protein At1g06140, mitochondrial [Dendrobium catenatum]XP_028554270.1 pentatricopeptide repeat-containing protein At1g06140, mitochondrial [Dendrobium catenatum]